MALTDSSTETDARNQYLANSSWHGNLSKAELRKEAIDWYLTHPQAMSVAGKSLSMNQAVMSAELAEINAEIRRLNSSTDPMFTRGITARRVW